MINPMNLTAEEFAKEFADFRKTQEAQDFQLKLQKNEHKFLAEQTERFLQAYSDTNNRLEAINASLQEQLTAAKAESKNARKDARFSKIISILSISIAFASLLVSLFLGLFL